MPTRQYVGARYVPKFYQNTQNPDSAEWEANQTYEALTIVTYNNGSYTSKIPVPAGIGNPAQNPTYWANTGNYNAQVELYRQETQDVQTFANQLQTNLNNLQTNIDNVNNTTLLILGDSWTEGDSSSPCFENALKPFFNNIYNYGKGGRYVSDIGRTAQLAYDAGVKPTHIYIVNGTNNVFHAHTLTPTSDNEIQEACSKIKQLFPYAEKHYFPNNAKTGNQGFTYLYAQICNIMASYGITPHPETLIALAFNNYGWYRGDDLIGEQHLTEGGLEQFAYVCHALANGGKDLCVVKGNVNGYSLSENVSAGIFNMTYIMNLNGGATIGVSLQQIKSATSDSVTSFSINASADKLLNPPLCPYDNVQTQLYDQFGQYMGYMRINMNNGIPIMQFAIVSERALTNESNVNIEFFIPTADPLMLNWR